MKRVVFVHPDGLHQICGVSDALPVTIEGFQALGRPVAFASLVRVTPRAAFYKEPTTPASYRFDTAQQ